ncbi:hypothetical protein O6H91_05G127400 [Diphasiastrum complanatum]|nr:hypothetical protein O6H91_05G127400 [Diphasiastrum complanatum]
MKAKKKRGVEPPPKVRAFINSVISTPLENIAIPLSSFTWDCEKGDFYHWVDLLNHFDTFFEKYVKSRNELLLDGDFCEDNGPFQKEGVLQILRVTRIILENCIAKYLYSSTEHLSTLLSSTDPEIVMAALQTLAVFVKKVQSNRPVRWHGDSALNARLFSLSQGWGGKEQGLGLLACATEIDCGEDACNLGSTLHFEFYGESKIQAGSENMKEAVASGLQVIHRKNIHMLPENDLQLLKQLVDEYKVPASLRFSLLTRIRFARAFPFLPIRREYISIRLLAFTVLLQSNPDHEDLAAFFVNEPEFVNELVTLLQCEDTVPEDIRILAILALAAQSQDRPRQSNVLNVISAGGHRGILPSLMQKAIGSLTGGTSGCSVAFVEALLSLVTVLVSSSSGCAALREAGLIPTLLPLLKDTDTHHLHLVTLAVHILEAFMDYSNPAGTLFRDLGGLDDTITRLKLEVSGVEHSSRQSQQELATSEKGKAVVVEDGEDQQMASVSQLETLIPYQQRLLLKALLRAIALGTYAPGNTARLHGSDESALPACLCTIFRHAKVFGGGVFSLAASVMSDLIHKEPTSYAALDEAGLPAAFLDSISNAVLPSSEAIGCIPNTLDAICVNDAGRKAVKDRNAMACFVKIFTSKIYLRALANDTPGSLASGLDELMRHQDSLREAGIDMCIEILRTIASIGGVLDAQAPAVQDMSVVNSPVPMDTDIEDRSVLLTPVEDLARLESSQQSFFEAISESSHTNMEAFLPECINNAVRLLETILQNSEICKIFIDKKGIEALLQLYTLSHLPVSFGGSSTAHNMSVTFRAFPPAHATALTRAVCGILRDHLKLTLDILMPVSDKKLSDIENGLQNKVLRSLSAVECFLSLSSVLVRSSAAMMAELSTEGADILNDIGKVHREVLWQISLIDHAKVESKKEGETGTSIASTSAGASVTATGTRENEDDTDSFPVVRYVNPVTIRNGLSSHWGVDAEFLPVIQAGEGLNRRTRRDHMATAEALTQIARLGRLARHAGSSQVELETSENQVHETLKRKSPETLNYEMMTRLVVAARGLYVALGKAMVVPSRRRDDIVPLTAAAKSVAGALVGVVGDNLSFDGHGSFADFDTSMSVKCRFLGKIVDDVVPILFDSRRRTCNTVIVNNLYAHGVIKKLLISFQATSQLLGTGSQSTGSPMDTESGKTEGEKIEDKVEPHAWLMETLQSYVKLLEQLVTSSLLLTPPSAAQLLVQPVEGGTVPLTKDPEVFVRAIQAQVLEVVLPVWNHPKFPQCPPPFIMSIASIITHVYTGTGDVKGLRNAAAGAGVRLGGPPPDESLISRIVEMGFSRSRAEEALRRVETNSVELAMEWLFSHPEEAPQDDEFARAVALSLSSSDGASNEADEAGKGKEILVEEGPQAPPVEEMLDTCMTLLQTTDAVAFALTDLLVTICNREKGLDRPRVISYLVQQLKCCKWREADSGFLSTICHIMALILSEDSTAREIGAQNGLAKAALDGLSHFDPSNLTAGVKVEVPKWVTALLLVLDHMLQSKPKINADTSSGTAGPSNSATVASDRQMGEAFDLQQEKYSSPLAAIIGKTTGYMTDDEQCRAMGIACNLLNKQLPATVVQAVLQLCARLTKVHSIALQFLEAGGLTALLALPRNCLFLGFDSVANAIIRHLLEDPQTLLQAMESEIRHTLTAASSRHSGRVSPRVFLTALAPVLSREPTIFMQAAARICQIDTIGGRMSVVLAKDKEKERDKDKEKDKLKLGSTPQNEGGPVTSLVVSTEAFGKTQDGSGKAAKGHKKVPHSFSQVIDQMLEVILHYPPLGKDEEYGLQSETSMEVDESAPKDRGKGKMHEKPRTETSGLPAATAKVTFILKLMSEVLLMYTSAVTVVLRRDSESGQGRGPSQGGLDVVGHGGLLYHVLHRLLPYPDEKVDKVDEDWREKLSDKAAYFLMAVCVRSGEGRRRVVQEVTRALNVAASSSSLKSFQPPSRKVRAFVDLVNSILSSHSSSSGAQAPGFSADMAKAMVDAGMVQALSQTLQVVDLDHPDAPKLVNAVLKALEVLTRAASSGEQVTGGQGTHHKRIATSERPVNVRGHPSASQQAADMYQHGLRGDSIQAELQAGDDGMQVTPSDANNRDEQMEHDMRSEGDVAGIHIETEGEAFMPEAAEDAAELEDATTEMAFRIDAAGGVGDDEDDEEGMDGDDAEDDGDDDEEEDEEDDDDIEGDEGVRLSPPDTDAEDHDNGLGDDFEEDMVEEEDEDDEWQEDQVIEVRWRDGLTGLNHVQVLDPAGGGSLVDFPGDPFPRINVDDVFGSFRRIGGGERRRMNNYRPFPDASVPRGGAFHHPLLTRPSQISGVGLAGVGSNSLWASAGNAARDAQALMGGGLDVTHFYMYDGPMLAEHVGDGVFSERGVGGPPPPLLDFSMDPVYLMGRRGGRSDTRLSSWTDDGQPQPGAHAAAVAQAIEEQFVAQLHSLLPSEELPATEAADVIGPTRTEEADGNQPDAVESMEGSEPESVAQVSGNEQQEAQEQDGLRSAANAEISGVGVAVEVPASILGHDGTGSSRPGTEVQIGESVTVTCHTDLDVQMQDERSEPAPQGTEVGSPDSGGSGATFGESLRSLEVEIGSADGHDEAERPVGSERVTAGDLPSSSAREIMRRQIAIHRRRLQGDADDDMDGGGPVGDMGDDETAGGTAGISVQQDTAVSTEEEIPVQGGQGSGASAGIDNTSGMTSIDPTFLEALPEDLRAEVLASQQTRPVRAADQPPPPTEIDPEFLAALPPDIQAEVIAQQRLQRALQAQHVEGQPVEMDSASILATFPAELREEVLLTSSEAVLAALPPALLAEAQLLRERVSHQFQARSLFGGAHRLASRRNNLTVAPGHMGMDRGAGGTSGFGAGRRPGLPFSGETRVKEAEGKPLVDTAALKAMLRLLRLAQPLGKGLLQRLLLNLCAHSETRATLVQLLLEMLRPEADGSIGSYSADGAPSQRLYGCQWNVVYARSQQSDGVPPLVSRHVLEILTYLARNQALVASSLLYMAPARSTFSSDSGLSAVTPVDSKQDKGKGKISESSALMDITETKPKSEIPLILLLKLLNQPLYTRSSAHLEQVMGLLEVVTSSAGAKADYRFRIMSPDSAPTALERSDPLSNIQPEELSSREGEGNLVSEPLVQSGPSQPVLAGKVEAGSAENQEPSTSGADQNADASSILLSLPQAELRNLCRLLAREGLSEMAYTRVAEVLKKLALAAPPHRDLFVVELADAARSLSGSAIQELQCLGDTETVVLTASSVAGAAILRVLQALSALTASSKDKEKESHGTVERDKEEGMVIVRELNLDLEPLWQELSSCVGKMEYRLGASPAFSALSDSAAAAATIGPEAVVPPLPLGTQKILPFVEAFFVLCEKLRSGPPPSMQQDPSIATACEIKIAASSSDVHLSADSETLLSKPPNSHLMKSDEKGITFVRFADKHRRLINAFVRQNPGLLEKSLNLITKVPRLIDFDNKRAHFRSKIRQQHERNHFTPLRISVRRAYVLEDSYNQLRIRTTDELKGRLTVQFQGEDGIDAGGLTREWFLLLSRVIFDKGALLFTTVGNESTFQPNPNSVYQTEHLSYFKFVGRVVAKALFDGQLLDAHFTRSFYKHILDSKITYHDMEAIDPDYFKNLKWLLEHDISDILDLTFSIDADEEKHILYEKTQVTDYELKTGGRNIRVTEENKHEYVDLVSEHRLSTAIRPQITAFLDGFHDLIGQEHIEIFNDKELELLINGLPDIPMEDLKSNTEYTGYTAASPVVQWFWEVVRAFNKEDLARLLQFITGTSKVPLGGFGALQGISGPQRFQIHKAYGAPERLPSAHT